MFITDLAVLLNFFARRIRIRIQSRIRIRGSIPMTSGSAFYIVNGFKRKKFKKFNRLIVKCEWKIYFPEGLIISVFLSWRQNRQSYPFPEERTTINISFLNVEKLHCPVLGGKINLSWNRTYSEGTPSLRRRYCFLFTAIQYAYLPAFSSHTIAVSSPSSASPLLIFISLFFILLLSFLFLLYISFLSPPFFYLPFYPPVVLSYLSFPPSFIYPLSLPFSFL